jgi:hypothetical protein
MHHTAKVKQGDGEEWCSQSKFQKIHGQHCSSQLERSLNCLCSGDQNELMVDRK